MTKSEMLKSLGFTSDFIDALDAYSDKVREVEISDEVHAKTNFTQADSATFVLKVVQKPSNTRISAGTK